MTVGQFDYFELRLPSSGRAVFRNGDESYEVASFLIAENQHGLRFMPAKTGTWEYTVDAEPAVQGSFECVDNPAALHPLVRADGLGFRDARGEAFYPLGTTIYAWIHQGAELIAQTLATLAKSPFNKVRMCLFPKHMPFNNNDPELYPFQRDADGQWDVGRPDFGFWDRLDDYLGRLRDLGIEADLILFHPYDRWGFAGLSQPESLAYLEYCLNRLSAYRNVWWSLANEYDLMGAKSTSDWDEYGELIARSDPYGHPISIHHCFAMYPRRDWMSHCSVQNNETGRVALWQQEYQLPVIIDECGYEGDIAFGWGNLSAFELVHRAWQAVANGGFITHGETFYRDDEVLWWAKGGQLYGQSPERFAFLHQVQTEIGGLTPLLGPMIAMATSGQVPEDLPPEAAMFARVIAAMPEHERQRILLNLGINGGRNENYRLQYHGRSCPSYMDIDLPSDGNYLIEVIDVWEMTRQQVVADATGKTHIMLPGKEGIAVLVTRLAGADL